MSLTDAAAAGFRQATADTAAALIAAGPHGATVAELCQAARLPERRCQRAVKRLIAERRARRDGERGRVYAIADAHGRPLPANDRRSRELAARHEAREFEARKGYAAGELADAARLLDGRRVPPGLGGQAEAARRYLSQAVRDVRSAPDPAALESMLAEARPQMEQVSHVIATVETAKREAAQHQAATQAARARLAEDQRRHLAALRKVEELQGRIAALPPYERRKAAELAARCVVMGRPLLMVGRWQLAPGLIGALSRVGTVTVSCPMTGAAVTCRAWNTGELLDGADAAASMVDAARLMLIDALGAIDQDRAALSGEVIPVSIPYDSGPRESALSRPRPRPALPAADGGGRQHQPTVTAQVIRHSPTGPIACQQCGRPTYVTPCQQCMMTQAYGAWQPGPPLAAAAPVAPALAAPSRQQTLGTAAVLLVVAAALLLLSRTAGRFAARTESFWENLDYEGVSVGEWRITRPGG